jgi:CheY-like chemotaxis protein
MNKILIVDDQPTVRELLVTTLELGDYKIISTEDSVEAIRLAKIESPDLILLDIMMPKSEFDGLEVCRRLKQDPLTTNITIIMLSAKGQRMDIEAGLNAGADDYIYKPFSPVSLIEKVESILFYRNSKKAS